MKVYVLNIALKDDMGGDIAGVYSSEEKAETEGKRIEERCKEHDIYKYGFDGWYVTEHDLDDEDDEEGETEE